MSSIFVVISQFFKGSPLRRPSFLLFFMGSMGTAIGYTMQGTVTAWLMSTLTTSALMVALVQTATTTPALIFGLVAGALADIVDRRKVILVTQWIMLMGVAVLGLAAVFEMIVPVTLLVLTFVIGSGFAFYMPAQLSSINGFVSRPELPKALALGAVSFNLARAVGPALAGALAAGFGTGNALVFSAAFFSIMIFAIRKWKRVERALPGVPERLLTGVRSGLRFAWHSDAMRALILRNFCFSLCASAYWALLPLIARHQLGMGAGGFGLLFGGFGSGAIVSAALIPGLIKRQSLMTVLTFGMVSWSVAIGLISIFREPVLGMLASSIAGFSWVVYLASLSTATQTTAPAWVRARAVSMYLVATQAGLAVGSMLWGFVTESLNLNTALGLSIALMLALHLTISRFEVTLGTEADVTPHTQLPELALSVEPMPDDGPVLIQIEYRVRPEHQQDFVDAMQAVGPTRRRSGASSWRVFRDLGEEERYIEQYVIASWADYLRQRARMTLADRTLLDAASRFLRADTESKISRLLGVESGKDNPEPA